MERGWCLFYWGAGRGEVSPDQFPCLVTPARGCLENACTAKLIQKRIHNLGGLSNFVAPSFYSFVSCFDCFNKVLYLLIQTGLFSALRPSPPLIHWVLGGFTNIAIKQSQCFYCALDLKIEAGLTAGSRPTYGKGPVFVCLYGDEWPVSTTWLVCTIKLSKRKDFSLIVPFREELWNSELFATAGELAGLRRGEGEGQTEFSESSVAAVRGDGDTWGSFLQDGKINLCVVSDEWCQCSDTVIQQAARAQSQGVIYWRFVMTVGC